MALFSAILTSLNCPQILHTHTKLKFGLFHLGVLLISLVITVTLNAFEDPITLTYIYFSIFDLVLLIQRST